MTTSKTRASFVKRFGRADAKAIERAAESHKNGIHDEPGSDYFRWAIVIAIGFQCMELAHYRASHGITAAWAELEEWIKAEGDLANHDGDADYLALAVGRYGAFLPDVPVP